MRRMGDHWMEGEEECMGDGARDGEEEREQESGFQLLLVHQLQHEYFALKRIVYSTCVLTHSQTTVNGEKFVVGKIS